MASRKWRGLGRALQAFGQGLGQTSQVLFAMSQAKEDSAYKRADFMATTLPQMLGRGMGHEGIVSAARQVMGSEYANYETAIERAIKNYPLVNAQNLILNATNPAQIDATVALTKDPEYLKRFGIEDPAGSVVADPDQIVEPGHTPRMKFTMPDGQVVDVGSGRAMEAAKVRGRLRKIAEAGRGAHTRVERDKRKNAAKVQVGKIISDFFTDVSGRRGGGGTGDVYDVGEAPGAVGAVGAVDSSLLTGGGGGRASVATGEEQSAAKARLYNLTVALNVLSEITTSLPLGDGFTEDDWAEVIAGVRPGVRQEIEAVLTAGRHLHVDAQGNQLGHPDGSPEEIRKYRETQKYVDLHDEYIQRIPDQDPSTPEIDASWMPSYITGRTMDAQAMLGPPVLPGTTRVPTWGEVLMGWNEDSAQKYRPAPGYPPLVGPGGARSPGEQLLDLPETDRSLRGAVEGALPYGWTDPTKAKINEEMERYRLGHFEPTPAERTQYRQLGPDIAERTSVASAQQETQEQLEAHRARQGTIEAAPSTDLPVPRDRAVNPYGQEIPMPPSAVSITEDITLSPEEESQFRTWYAGWAAMPYTNMDNDPDAGSYAYRLAWKSGAEPSPVDGHWTSKFKFDDHPNRYVATSDGTMDSRSGEMVAREPSPGETPNLQIQGIASPFGQTITPVQREFLVNWLSPEPEPFDPLGADVEFDVGLPAGGPPDLPIAGAQRLPVQRGIYGPGQVETPPPEAEWNVGLPAAGAPQLAPQAPPQAPLPVPQPQAMQYDPGVTSAELAGAAPPPGATYDIPRSPGGFRYISGPGRIHPAAPLYEEQPAAPARQTRYGPGEAPMHEEPLDTGGEPASGGERRYPGRFQELPKFEEFLDIISQVSRQEGTRPKINADQREFYKTLKGHIEQYGAQFGVNPMLVAMVIYEETSFNGDPRSWRTGGKGAQGVMQVLDSTAREVIQRGLTRFIEGEAFFSDEGVGNWPDWARENYRPQDRPADGIHVGVAYLRFLVDKYEGPEYPGLKEDQQSLWRIVLQAWNVGPGKMDESIKGTHGSWQNAIAAWNANPGQGWPYVTAFARAISLGAGLGSDAFE